jgi:tRNA threonylcarbamoyl adenosine modification protein YjeE
MEIFYTLLSIQEAVYIILPYLYGGACIAIHGEMGAGKTTLVSHIAASYGIEQVSSPTYSIVNEYPLDNHVAIAHMDWYRLETAAEIIDAGILEYISSTQYITIIEWSERAPELLPAHCVHLYISMMDPDTRCLRLEVAKDQ